MLVGTLTYTLTYTQYDILGSQWPLANWNIVITFGTGLWLVKI